MKIQIDKNTPLKEFNHHYKFCVGSAHAVYALRHDYVKQLTEIHNDLGIERVRFHGIFDDNMHTILKATDIIPFPFGSKYIEKSFRQCANAYDNVISAGMRPYVELSFMPKHLAKLKFAKGMFYYKPIVSMPKLMNEWENYIKDFVKFLINRYGKDEVESWNFEVWNEPDIPVVFFDGSQKDYFRLYSATAKAIKSVDDKIKVGGPATSGSKWIKEFLSYCKNTKTPVDFISTHQYAGDPIGGIENGEKGLSLKINLLAGLKNRKSLPKDNVIELFRSFMGVLDASKTLNKKALTESAKNVKALVKDLPLYYTEWNMCASFSAECNDTSMQAAYILHAIKGTQKSIDGSSIWCFSDLFEEFHQFPEEFHGGFGLVTQSGIKKPSYFALKFLNEAGEKAYQIDTEESADALIFDKGDEIHIILSMLDFKESNKSENIDISIELSSIPKAVSETVIDEENCNPLKAWKKLGKPQVPNKAQLNIINSASAPVEKSVDYDYSSGFLNINTSISSNQIRRIIVKK